jgi:hypothetical protein
VTDIGAEDGSGDIGSGIKLVGRVIISGLRVGIDRSGSEGTLNSSLVLFAMLIGAPSVEGVLPSRAIFLGATGALYPDDVFVLELDDERDEEGRASMIVVGLLCIAHTNQDPFRRD